MGCESAHAAAFAAFAAVDREIEARVAEQIAETRDRDSEKA